MPTVLDPDMEALRASYPDLSDELIGEIGDEALLKVLRADPLAEFPFDPAMQIRDITVPTRSGDVRLRVYRPSDAPDLPIYVNLHGGGWVGGTLAQDDYRCQFLSHHARVLTVSIDYYFAPEHKFPVALDQCEEICRAIRGGALDVGADASRIALGGSSAGGNLAAALAHRLGESGAGWPAGMTLTYPVCDHGVGYPSVREFRNGYSLTADIMHWFWNHYVRGTGDFDNPQVVPMRAASLGAMPPTLIITAEADVLRDEAEAYARRLEADGADVTLRRMAGVIHGFLSAAPMHPQSQVAFAEMAAFLRKTLSRKNQMDEVDL